MPSPAAPLKTFIIYARDDAAYKDQLLLHLRPLVVSGMLRVWHDGAILPGEDWEKAIKKELKASELVILLVSVHALNSDFIQAEELRTALDGLEAGFARVVPVVVSPCVWKFDPVVSRLQALPSAGAAGILPVSEWKNANLAWTNVVEQIGDMVQELRQMRVEQLQAEQRRLETEEKERARLEAEKVKQQLAQTEAEQQEQQRREAGQKAEQQRAEQAVKNAEKAEQQEEVRRQSPTSRTRYLIGACVLGLLLLLVWKPWRKAPDRKPGNGTIQEAATAYPAEALEQDFAIAEKTGTIPAWRKFRDEYPGSAKSEDAQKHLDRLGTEFKQALSTADAFVKEGLYKEAYEKLRLAETIYPGTPEVQRRLATLPKSKK